MNLFKRTMNIFKEEKEQIATVDMWVVSWMSRHGDFSGETKKNYQSFFTFEDACKFKRALDDANRLIGNTSGTRVDIEKRSNGL